MNAVLLRDGGWVEAQAANDSAGHESAWVKSDQEGDARAFERLYRAHAARIHGLCLRLSNGDAARAAQSTQDVFVRAWEKLALFRGEAAFSTWLQRWVTFEEPEDFDAAVQDETHHPQERVGLRMDLERALARLPKGARSVLLLHDVEGYQHDEIAELTGIAVGTSKAQLHRARQLMKEMLQ